MYPPWSSSAAAMCLSKWLLLSPDARPAASDPTMMQAAAAAAAAWRGRQGIVFLLVTKRILESVFSILLAAGAALTVLSLHRRLPDPLLAPRHSALALSGLGREA